MTTTSLSKVYNYANVINIADHASPPLNPDGVTSNDLAFANFQPYGKTVGLTFPATVTISIANPGVISWVGHGLRVNEAVVLQTTGALPTGLTAGVTYYVIPAGLTLDAFQVSTLNARILQTGFGAAIITSGSQSGVHSCQVQGADWQEMLLPPGNYWTTTVANFLGNQRRVRLSAYGAAAVNLNASAIGLSQSYIGTQGFKLFAYLSSITNNTNQESLTLQRASDTAFFDIGGWLAISALDMMDTFGFPTSYPPNNHYFEFAQISAINAGTGVITLVGRLRNKYKTTFPKFYDHFDPGNAVPPMAGAAMIWPMCSDWDMEVEVRGLRSINQSGGPGGGALTDSIRSIKWVDCVWNADGPDPTVNQRWIAENCVWGAGPAGTGVSVEVDKMIEDCRLIDCAFLGQGGVLVQSSSVQRLLIQGLLANSVTGTGRITHIIDSSIAAVVAGPVGFGLTDSLLIEDSVILKIDQATRFGDQAGIAGAFFSQFLGNYTFANGVLSQPMVSTSANAWAIPGMRCWLNDMAAQNTSMGGPFTILDVYQTQAATAAVTISIASPGVVAWNAHGRSVGDVISFSTTGALPTGLFTSTPYYVLAAGFTANAFELSAAPGGAAINTTGSQSGVHTAYANPLFSIQTTLQSLPSAGPSSTVTLSIATPAVVGWVAHGLVAGTPFVFQTTGALPTGVNKTTVYYVIAAGLTADAFEFSTAVGGAAVNTTGSQSGTQKAVSNPLHISPIYCNKVTVRNSSGCGIISDMSDGPPGLPLFSYATRTYSNMVQDNPVLYHPIYVRGKLVSMTVEVLLASTIAATFTISGKAFATNFSSGDLSQTIDLAVAGVRTITPAAAIGSVGNDSIVAFSNWLSDSIQVHLNAGPSLNTLFKITIQTDQTGKIGDVFTFMSQNPSGGPGHPEMLVDSYVLASEGYAGQ